MPRVEKKLSIRSRHLFILPKIALSSSWKKEYSYHYGCQRQTNRKTVPSRSRKHFIVTEYFCLHSYCKHCRRHFTAKLPQETRSGLFGANLIALTAYLKGRCHLSYTTLRAFSSDVFSIKVSTGFLANQVRKASNALQKPYKEPLEQLPKASHLHVDESGHKENGKGCVTK